MPVTTFLVSFIEYSKGAYKKKRRDITIEDIEKKSDEQKKPEPEPEVEIGREEISRDGFWPTWIQTPARRDPTRDFKLRVEFSAERAEFFPVFIPGNARKQILSGSHGTLTLELEDGEEGILCVLEHAEDGALQFTMLDLWGPVHITMVSAVTWGQSAKEILSYFSNPAKGARPEIQYYHGLPRCWAIVEKFFGEELEQERKRAEEEWRRAEEERNRLENKGRLAGLLSDLKSLIKKGGMLLK